MAPTKRTRIPCLYEDNTWWLSWPALAELLRDTERQLATRDDLPASAELALAFAALRATLASSIEASHTHRR